MMTMVTRMLRTIILDDDGYKDIEDKSLEYDNGYKDIENNNLR